MHTKWKMRGVGQKWKTEMEEALLVRDGCVDELVRYWFLEALSAMLSRRTVLRTSTPYDR